MLNWGCEFLDLELYKEPVETTSKVIYLPLEFIARTIDPLYAEEIRRKNFLYIEELTRDIAEHGIREPGTLVISPMRIKLQDGNHRYLSADALKLKRFPVVTEYTDGKLNAGLRLQDLVEDFLCSENLKNA